MRQTLEFFFDCASPYTYLAATQMEGLAQRTGGEIVWRPFLIGAAFKATGNQMPASVPAKGKYMFEDLKLWSALYKVPFSFPKIFPINSLLPQRVACALPADRIAQFALAMMTAYWTQGADIQQAAVLENILNELGHDGAGVLAASGSDEVKAALKAQCEDAISRGAFGAPTFFIGKTQFWGNDRLGMIEEMLCGRLVLA